MLQIREGSQVKNPIKLVSWPEKMTGELKKIRRETHLLTRQNGPFAASGHMVHAGEQAAHWDIQNKATSSR